MTPKKRTQPEAKQPPAPKKKIQKKDQEQEASHVAEDLPAGPKTEKKPKPKAKASGKGKGKGKAKKAKAGLKHAKGAGRGKGSGKSAVVPGDEKEAEPGEESQVAMKRPSAMRRPAATSATTGLGLAT